MDYFCFSDELMDEREEEQTNAEDETGAEQ